MLLKPSPTVSKRLDKVIRYLAKGYSNRAIEAVLKIDRASYRFYFLSDKCLTLKTIRDRVTVSKEFSDKVCKDVLNNKLTYWQVRKKWGVKGLEALHTRWVFLRMQRDKDLIKKIVPMRAQGMSFNKIAEKLGICAWSANMFYRKHSKRPNVNVQRMKAIELHTQILTLYKQGLTTTEISKKVQRSRSHISHVLNRLGISTKKPGLSKEDRIKVYKLRQAGMSWVEIGYIFGKSPAAVATDYRNHLAEVEAWVKEQDLVHQ